jgi:hypothetical protein
MRIIWFCLVSVGAYACLCQPSIKSAVSEFRQEIISSNLEPLSDSIEALTDAHQEQIDEIDQSIKLQVRLNKAAKLELVELKKTIFLLKQKEAR